MSKEFTYINIAKGLGIFLVVLGHYVNPFFIPEYFQHIIKFIYTFHMPLFMAMSGFLFGKVFGKINNYRSFILKKSQRLMVPYFIISILLFGIKYIAGLFVPLKYPAELNSLLYHILVQPNSGFAAFLWFMYTLFLIFCIVPFFHRLWILGAFSFILYYLPLPDAFCINLVGRFLIYFTFGIWIYQQRETINNQASKFPILFIILLCLYLIPQYNNTVWNTTLSLLVGLCGSFFVYLTSLFISCNTKSTLYKCSHLLGKTSSEIYLLHTFCMGAIIPLLSFFPIRIPLIKFHIDLIITVCFGIIGPIFLSKYFILKNKTLSSLLLGIKSAHK